MPLPPPTGIAVTRRAALAASAAFAALAACRGATDPVPAADPLTTRVESAAHVYVMAAGDRVDTTRHEAHFRWLTATLGAAPPGRIEYRKYRDRAHMERLTGRATNGFAEPEAGRVHSIWAWDGHEEVHAVVVPAFGEPPALFNEGVAVALTTDPFEGDLVPRWNGTPVDTIAARLDASGQLPALGALVESRAFFAASDQVTYPVSGSWVRYLLERRGGVAPFRALLAGGSWNQSAAATRARFRAAYGVELDSAWADWRRALRAR